MKKVTFILLTIFISALVFGQGSEQPCITCNGNRIDFTKGASAIGAQNQSIGINSFAVGYLNKALGDYSIAMPFMARSVGDRSLALGYNANANGMGSLALGTHSHTGENAVLSVAIGSLASTSANWAMVLGMGSGDSLLTNRIQSSFMAGFNSNLPTFFVDPSDGIGTTGKIGIGNITAPTAKLHIKADNDEDASILLESTGSYYGKLMFGTATANHYIQARSGSNMQFKTENNQDFVFENGNVGIGTNQPKAKIQVKDGDIFIEDIDRGIMMKSPNGSCWRGTVTDDGQLQFTQVDCGSLVVTSTESLAGKDYGICIYPNPTGNRVTVEIPARYTGTQLNIKTSDGRELFTKSLISNSNIINMSNYPTGVYFFYISNKGKLMEVKKVIKE